MFDDEVIPGFATAADAGRDLDAVAASPLEAELVALFDQLRDPLLRYLLSFNLRVQDGEEIIQEVFLALFQHLRRGKPRHNLRAWVFQVAHNMALRQCNVMRRNRYNLVEYGGISAREIFVDRSPNPEDQLAGKRRRVRLLGVLQALPETDRRCLLLRTEGLTYREIAQVLEMSLGAVSLSLARTLARLTRAAER